MTPNKLIIDTDPGCDDILALLLALASSPEDLEVLLISVTYGNVDVQNCLRNVVSMFNVIEKEMQWRRSQGLPEGFGMLKKRKPVVAAGAEGPLDGRVLMADYYHGPDGLGDVHKTHPHHTSPVETWSHLFEAPPQPTLLSSTATTASHAKLNTNPTLFTPSYRPSHEEILSILDSNPPDTITLIAIGPLTNLATAAAADPTVFTKAKEVIIMGGTISSPGNITPVAEFNCIADPIAAARLYALTSPNPESTMPPAPSQTGGLPPYPAKEKLGSRRLNTTLFPLDITTPHTVTRAQISTKTWPLIEKNSPLAEWVAAFMSATFTKSESLYLSGDGLGGGVSFMCLHDIVCIWYALSSPSHSAAWQVKKDEDVRVETRGQWTRGMCVVDRREMRMLEGDGVEGEEVSGDSGGWLRRGRGNRVARCVGTPGAERLAGVMLDTIFG